MAAVQRAKDVDGSGAKRLAQALDIQLPMMPMIDPPIGLKGQGKYPVHPPSASDLVRYQQPERAAGLSISPLLFARITTAMYRDGGLQIAKYRNPLPRDLDHY